MYKEYHRLWYLMILSKNDLDESISKLDRIEEELTKTTVSMKEDISGHGGFSDKMGKLIAQKVDLEDIVKSQSNLYNSRKKRVNKKIKELIKSDDTNDIIYRRKFIDKERVVIISREVHYTREYTYDLISKIRSEIATIQDDLREKHKKRVAS